MRGIDHRRWESSIYRDYDKAGCQAVERTRLAHDTLLCSSHTFFFVLFFLFSPGLLHVLCVSHKLNFIMLSSFRSCNSYSLFTLPFLSKQTRHWRNIISFYFFSSMSCRAKCLSSEQYVD